MDRKRHRTEGPPALDLIEEAVHLLRRLPVGAWLAYALGMIPFALALLFFQADMSRGAHADGRLAVSALTLVLFYLWMKDRQSAFARALRATIHRQSPVAPTLRQRWNLLILNAALHPTGLLALPVALVITLPFPVVMAFYQSVSALADGDEPSLRKTFARCARQAGLWTGQNFTLQLILQCFGFFVFLNWFITLGQFPHLLKMLLGIETSFTRGGMWSLLNTTYLFTVLTLTWLCVSPIFRAVYALRCFYGEALTTAEDLRGELNAITARKRPAAAALAALLVLAGASSGAVAAENSPAGKTGASANDTTRIERLDRAFDDVLRQAEFSWRSPRVQTPDDAEKGWLAGQLEALARSIERGMLKIRDFAKRVIEWLVKRFRSKPREHASGGGGSGWQATLQLLVYALVAAVLIAICQLLYRVWRQPTPKAVLAETVAPDLEDENVTADELPEDEWLKLASDLLGQGDARLALRALYLACLAHLGERELLTISRAKSNREYQRELQRRARARDDLQSAFAANVLAFERAWYGVHETTRAICDQAEANLRRIREC